MVSCSEYDRDKLYAELAWLEIYKEIIEHKLFSKDKELYICEYKLKYSNQVQFNNTVENKYVWAKLEGLGYKADSYYNYPIANGESGIKIYW